MSRAFAFLLTGAVVGAVACATATGEVQGGDALFDAAAPSFAPDAAAGGCLIGDDAGSGTKWSDLYRDFFGPTGAGTCVGDGTCHGNPDQAGASVSKFICADEAACRTSLLSEASGLVRLPQDISAPDNSGLIQTLRRKNPDGTIIGLMPKRPKCTFDAPALARITTWIKAGAPAD